MRPASARMSLVGVHIEGTVYLDTGNRTGARVRRILSREADLDGPSRGGSFLVVLGESMMFCMKPHCSRNRMQILDRDKSSIQPVDRLVGGERVCTPPNTQQLDNPTPSTHPALLRVLLRSCYW